MVVLSRPFGREVSLVEFERLRDVVRRANTVSSALDGFHYTCNEVLAHFAIPPPPEPALITTEPALRSDPLRIERSRKWSGFRRPDHHEIANL